MNPYALIATFEPDTARLLGALVGLAGLDPVVARDGAEAGAILERDGPPALFITELSLPRADGFALLGDLRRLASAEVTPAIVVSSFPAFRSTAWSLKDSLGISAVVSPADSREDLGAAIDRALDPKRRGEARPPASPAEAARGEHSRLALIASMAIVDDRPPEETLQRLVEDTAKAFGVPIALVSLVLKDRQWFKAYFGLSDEVAAARSTPREISFCRHVVEGDLCQPLVVPDALVHPYFAANPLVRSGVVRSYAGAPLVTPGGQVLGTLCIIDTKPLNIGPDEVDALVTLARRVAGELELRASGLRAPWVPSAAAGNEEASHLLKLVCSTVESGILVLDADRKVLLASQALGDLSGIPSGQIQEMTREEFILRVSTLCDDRAGFLRKMRVLPDGPFSARELFEMVSPVRRVIRWIAKPVHLPGGTGQLEMFDDVTREMDRAAGRVRPEPSVAPARPR